MCMHNLYNLKILRLHNYSTQSNFPNSLPFLLLLFPSTEQAGVVLLCWLFATSHIMHRALRTLNFGPTPMSVWLQSGDTSCRGLYIHDNTPLLIEWETRQIVVRCGVWFSVLSVMLRNAIYSNAHKNATTACASSLVQRLWFTETVTRGWLMYSRYMQLLHMECSSIACFPWDSPACFHVYPSSIYLILSTVCTYTISKGVTNFPSTDFIFFLLPPSSFYRSSSSLFPSSHPPLHPFSVFNPLPAFPSFLPHSSLWFCPLYFPSFHPPSLSLSLSFFHLQKKALLLQPHRTLNWQWNPKTQWWQKTCLKYTSQR